MYVHTLIIGAGPSGLACASTLANAGSSVLVVERGSAHPDRGPIEGVGGAGLYSDGKFSFYPSGTALWALKPTALLRDAYNSVQLVLRSHAIPAPDWSPEWESPPLPNQSSAFKPYPSTYGSLKSRVDLINHLSRGIPFLKEAAVTAVTFVDGFVHAEVTHNGTTIAIKSRHIVVASGRLWNDAISLPTQTIFRRYEVGVRVEQPSETFIFADHHELDPKWIVRLDSPRRELRSFCCCRHGATVAAETSRGILYSGSSDGPDTSRSNFGLMVRYLEGATYPQGELPAPFELPAQRLLDDEDSLADDFGLAISRDLALALRRVYDEIGVAPSDAILRGPCLEGVGDYPLIDQATLRSSGGERAWFTGDATGIFRGLVPALVSGAFVGAQILDNK